jgi:hypothetical protein
MKTLEFRTEKNGENSEVDRRQLEIKVIVGRFILKKRIGGGSFGEIYLADDLLKNIPVAVKTECIDAVVPHLPSEWKIQTI